MARNNPVTKYQFKGDTKDLNKKLDQSQRKIKDVGDTGLSSFKKVGIGIAAGVLAIKQLFSALSLLQEKYKTQLVAETKLEQVIKSTGGAAGKTADELKRSAANLQELTGIGDEDILVGATNKLLTFTQIQGDVFDEALQTTLDLSVAMEGDLKGAAIQLGKALNDPIKGVSALTKVGVSFTEQQKEQIKALQETGKIQDAQRVILAELNKEFGGQAKAVGDALGAVGKYENSVGDLQETLGKLVKEGFEPVAQGIKNAAEGLDDYLSLNPSEEFEQERIEVNALVGAIVNQNEGSDIRKSLIEDLKTEYPDYLKLLGDEELSNENLTKTLKEYNKQILTRIELAVIGEELLEEQRIKREALNKVKTIENDINTQYIEIQKSILDIDGKLVDTTISREEKLKAINEHLHNLAIAQGIYVESGKEQSDLQNQLNDANEEYEKSLTKINELLKEIADVKQKNNIVDKEGNDGNDDTNDKLKDQIETIKKLKRAVVDLPDEYKKSIEGIKEGTGEGTDYILGLIDDVEDKLYSQVAVAEGVGQALGQGFVDGADGLKDALKNSLIILIDYFQRYVLALQIKALGGTFFGDFTGFAKIAGVQALFEVLKGSVDSFATGGTSKGGLALVGEEGPELVNFNRGDQIQNTRKTQEILADGGDLSETNNLLRQLIVTMATPKSFVKNDQVYVLYESAKKNRLRKD